MSAFRSALACIVVGFATLMIAGMYGSSLLRGDGRETAGQEVIPFDLLLKTFVECFDSSFEPEPRGPDDEYGKALQERSRGAFRLARLALDRMVQGVRGETIDRLYESLEWYRRVTDVTRLTPQGRVIFYERMTKLANLLEAIVRLRFEIALLPKDAVLLSQSFRLDMEIHLIDAKRGLGANKR